VNQDHLLHPNKRIFCCASAVNSCELAPLPIWVSRGSGCHVVSLVVFAFAATSFSCLAADRVLFARLGPSEATLFVSIANSSGERTLTQPGSLNYKSSRSKDWIVFTSERGESADLYRTHPDGSGLERLTDDPAAFSPDGKQIVCVSTRASGRANLWILDIVTRKATPLTSGDGGDFRPSWSPDGSGSPSRPIGEAIFHPPKADVNASSSRMSTSFTRTAAACSVSQSTEVFAAAPNGRRTARTWSRIACLRRRHGTTALLRRMGTTNSSASTSPRVKRHRYPPALA
jgi:hypothetical protein